jgi:hypothetical protein
MKSKAIFALAAAALLASIGTSVAQTELLTFDDLTFSGLYDQIPNGYGGLQWNNFDALNTVQETHQYGVNGAVNGMVSPNNVAFDGGGTNASFSDNVAFNLNSAYLAGVWNDGLQVEVQGFVGSTLTYDNTYTVNTQGPTLIDFNYAGVDEVNFIAYGGTPHGYYFGRGTEFAMDNLSVTLVPEPATYALGGLAGIILAIRRLTPRKNHFSK